MFLLNSSKKNLSIAAYFSILIQRFINIIKLKKLENTLEICYNLIHYRLML